MMRHMNVLFVEIRLNHTTTTTTTTTTVRRSMKTGHLFAKSHVAPEKDLAHLMTMMQSKTMTVVKSLLL